MVFRIEMAGRGRDDAAIAEALGMLAGVLGGNPNVVGIGAARQLSEFQKNNPPMFKGAYDPDGAQKWLKEIERIFRVTECADNQKVRFGTHMLSEEADDWWVSTRTELEAAGGIQREVSEEILSRGCQRKERDRVFGVETGQPFCN